MAAALAGVRRGARVALVERGALGGTCVHAGCIPSGAFHRTAEVLDEVSRAAAVGVRVGPAQVDWPRMQGWVGSVVTRAASITRASLEAAGVELVAGAGRFTGPCHVEAAGRLFEGVPVVVATGAVSAAPEGALGNEEAMALDRAPARLLVAGAARFSLEWADFFAHLGSKVIVATPGDHVLPNEDADIAGFLQVLLEERGIEFRLGSGPEGIEADVVLYADARAPNVAGLALDAAGIETGLQGAITVDDGCRTSAARVFAAGDVTGPPWLSNRARAQGAVAAANALGGSAKVRPERLPRSVNTHPELAAVGLSEEQARARGLEPAIGFGELATSLRGITLGEDRGALKLVVDPEFGEILGAHMVGVGAVEVVAQVAAAMELEADYRDLGRINHLHPSLAELVSDAVAAI